MPGSEIRHGFREDATFLRAVLDCFADGVAVLDANGRIVLVNCAWPGFSRVQEAPSDETWIGKDYLAACGESAEGGAEGGRAASIGIRDVLAGEREQTEVIYACHGPKDQRWLRLHASGFEHAGARWVLVVQREVTERNRAKQQLGTYQNRLKALASQLTMAEERERRRVAEELHDKMGQSLAFMRMQLAAVRRECDGRKVASTLDEVSASLRQAIVDTRDIISGLSSPLVSELGLGAATAEWLRQEIGERYGLESTFSDDGAPKRLSDDARIILFRGVRELLTNVVKHAGARRVSVSLQRIGGDIQIVVEDDGIGLAKRSDSSPADTAGGFGLFSIAERMRDLGGSLLLDNRRGGGVRAVLTAPLETE